MVLSNKKKIELLERMILVRCFELAVCDLKDGNLLMGPVHTAVGQEASEVGICAALSKSDYVLGSHRSHGIMLAKGANINSTMAEIFGKKTGCNGGRGGSMHVIDKSCGGVISTAIVGSGLPLSCGFSFASKFLKTNQITTVFFGDGAAQEGVFHESLNLASVLNLPIIFVLLNNQLAITTKLSDVASETNLSARASSYGMEGYSIDGQDVFSVYESAERIVRLMRVQPRPVLVELNTIRFREHQEGLAFKKISESGYRDLIKLQADLENFDPIVLASQRLLQEGVLLQTDIEAVWMNSNDAVLAAIEFSKNSPDPDPDSVQKNIYVD